MSVYVRNSPTISLKYESMIWIPWILVPIPFNISELLASTGLVPEVYIRTRSVGRTKVTEKANGRELHRNILLS